MTATASGRYLTKSRFMLGLDCPTKLDYTGKHEYVDGSRDDSFLQALAEGGFQVGELARQMYPGGELINESGHGEQIERTNRLLQHDCVTIYEAAVRFEDCFARIDILRKSGNRVELIEVKAKSFDSSDAMGFRGRGGGISSGFRPYLQDLAFQSWIFRNAHPEFELRSLLMLADKSKRTSVDGLNQRFRIRRVATRASVTTAPGTDSTTIGSPILTAVPADTEVGDILASSVDLPGTTLPFVDAIRYLAEAYVAAKRIDPVLSANCAKCEFRTAKPPAPGEPRSGFHECWKQALGWTDGDFAAGTVLELWNSRAKNDLIKAGKHKLTDIRFEDIAPTEGEDGLTWTQRQWMQASGRWPGGGDYYLDRDRLRVEMRTWRYPLHFIDFETSTVAIPFTAGRRPYEIVAFQFSHHVMHEGGRVEHRGQFIQTAPGIFPNISFVRALKSALAGDGTIFRWAAHENTVLRIIRKQITDVTPSVLDGAELVAFIDEVTTWKDGRDAVHGRRAMVDLRNLAERCFFHPMTNGSSSLKKVLPAAMASSDRLRTIYGRPIYGQGDGVEVVSLNFASPVAWWRMTPEGVMDPYAALPPIFSDLGADAIAALQVSEDETLAEGGAAAMAYARLQFEELPLPVRQGIESALLRYCELDTLAMVMVVQAWQGWM